MTDEEEHVPPPAVQQISAVTLATRDMVAAYRFYHALGFRLRYGGEGAAFTSFIVGEGYLNLQLVPGFARGPLWGRVVIYVDDVDAMYARALSLGLTPSTAPRDAEWGERYFHLSDPDGHELSFAKLLM
jgi:catechol 2,3-dioxygenase-like lactoylglutathione lyase family enzyme